MFAKTFCALILLAATAVPSALAACTSGIPLNSGEVWQDGGGQTEGSCFRVDITESSLLVFQLRQPAVAARAHLAGIADDGEVDGRLLHHSPATLVAAVTPGVYHLQVAADDSTKALGVFQLRFDRLRIPTKDENDPELDPEPNPLVVPCIGCQGLPDFDENDPELDPEPNPLRMPGLSISSDLSRVSGLGRAQLATLCGDHDADSFLCAVALETEPVLGAAFEKDTIFRFPVRRLGPVEIRAEGDGIAELYDRHGQRLEVLSGESGEIRGVRTLVPGVYFLRVAGQ